MKKQRFLHHILIWIFIFLILCQPVTALADMGPKPCIYVTFNNIGDRTVYATLFALEGGPSPVSFGDWKNVPDNVKQVFLSYAEKEEARFVEDVWIINNETPVLDCSYMPPETYKLVVYIPDEEKILESGYYKREQMFERYIVNIDAELVDGKLLLDKEPYDWAGAIGKTALRLVLTLIIEIIIALLFKIKGVKSIGVLIATNVVTQVFLNTCLLLKIHKSGAGLGMVILYIFLEILIFIIEAVVYSITLKKTNEPPVGTGKSTAYAFIANLVSFIAGLFLG